MKRIDFRKDRLAWGHNITGWNKVNDQGEWDVWMFHTPDPKVGQEFLVTMDSGFDGVGVILSREHAMGVSDMWRCRIKLLHYLHEEE